jgi:hypothetical protein
VNDGAALSRDPLGMDAWTLRVVATALVGFLALLLCMRASAAPARSPEPRCPSRAYVGTSERAAEAVVEVFVRTAVVGSAGPKPGACVLPSVAVPGLVHPRYETRYPQRLDGWYQLAPKIRNDRGFWEYAGFLYLSAPDVRPAAFQFLLELHGNRWLVSSFEVAPGAVEVNPENTPT